MPESDLARDRTVRREASRREASRREASRREATRDDGIGHERGVRLGILGGTFDPPHRGHLALAECARRTLDLDEVLLMPAHTPPHKPPQPVRSSPADRLQMCRLAVAGIDGVSVSDLEVRRGGPSYTVDTLEAIGSEPSNAHLTLVVGSDMALALPSWRDPRRLLELADLAVAHRGGTSERQVLDALAQLGADQGGVRFLRMPPVEVSSSAVRARVAAGEPIDEMVPQPVARHIAERGLYREQVAW